MQIPEIKDKELHRVVTTTAIYTPDFKYLITKRSLDKKVQPGKWCFPGGGLTVDDYINTKPATSAGQWYGALSSSLVREIKEEVNLEVGKPELLTDLTFIRLDGIPVICFTYFAPYVKGEVVLDNDCTDFAWVSLEEAKNYDLIEGIWGELSQIDEILKSRK
ncbi:MAG: NUDIX domain-containing protein [Parcubacteria group bacterium]